MKKLNKELANSFKVRASAAGKLMTNPRSKSEVLSETTKSYAKEWLKEQFFGVKKEIKSKYLEKGNILEDEGIDKAISWLNLEFALKNEKYFEDEYFSGTPDLILKNEIIDIKISYDCFTFPIFEDKLPTIDYAYQVLIYMHLTGLRRARVVYLLLNTPEDIAPWDTSISYDDVPKEYRIKTFDVEYDEKVIETLKSRVENVREYLTGLIKIKK